MKVSFDKEKAIQQQKLNVYGLMNGFLGDAEMTKKIEEYEKTITNTKDKAMFAQLKNAIMPVMDSVNA